MSFKVGQKVTLVSTSYTNPKFKHHGDVAGKIVSLEPKDTWASEYVPEYRIEIDKNTVLLIPQYSINA